jgi:hypothetical protein
MVPFAVIISSDKIDVESFCMPGQVPTIRTKLPEISYFILTAHRLILHHDSLLEPFQQPLLLLVHLLTFIIRH